MNCIIIFIFKKLASQPIEGVQYTCGCIFNCNL